MKKGLQHATEGPPVAKNALVREGTLKFRGRLGNLSERERIRMRRTFDEMVPKIPEGTAAAVDREIAELRRARKTGGRRTCAT